MPKNLFPKRLAFAWPAAGAEPQPWRDRDHGWTHAATAALMSAVVIELIVGGPGFWQIAGISIRRTLVALLALWLVALCALGRCRPRAGHLLLLASTALFLLTWMVLIPSIYDSGRIGDAVQEGIPLVLLFPGILLHAYYLDNPRAWASVRRAATLSLVTVAVVALAVWMIGAFGAEDPILIAVAAATFFTWGNADLQPSFYIQRMPDGFFRVMWITSVLFATALIYCLHARRMFGATLFILALFVCYTRALWLSAAIGVLLALFLGPSVRPPGKRTVTYVSLTGLLLGALAFVDLMGEADTSALRNVGSRLATTFSDESADERAGQVLPLIDAWQSAPWLGAGLGSAAPTSTRSDVAPYLYELTYLALLMKLGIVGLLVAAALVVVLMLRRSRQGVRPVHIDACIVAFLIACGTNPYLLNLVGLGLLCFLFIERDLHRPSLRRQDMARPIRAGPRSRLRHFRPAG